MRTQDLVRRHQPPASAPEAGGPRGRPSADPAPRGGLQRLRPFALDIAWVAFAGINLAAMRLFPAWQTVPFLAIWVSLTAVADSGCGIPSADLDHIFGRFTRAEPYRSRETGGFGLGLPIAAAIAEAHGGSVRVHSTSGQGATFEMVVPAVAG